MEKEMFLIVSRHAAGVQFTQLWLSTQADWCDRLFKAETGVEYVPVLASVTADDVRGKVVIGNLPLHLGELAASVVAIEFAGQPPRGQEYDLAAMQAAGARLVEYVVRTPQELKEVADQVASETPWFRTSIETGRPTSLPAEKLSRTIPGPPCGHCGDVHETANCEA